MCHEGDIGSELTWWQKVLMWTGILKDSSTIITIQISRHPTGPWKVVSSGHFMTKSWTWRTWTSNPSLYVHPNGTHYMAYKGKDWTVFTRPKVGIAWAPRAEGPWEDWAHPPVLHEHVEDPHLYYKDEQLQMLLHVYREDSSFSVWNWNASGMTPLVAREPYYARQRPAWLYDKNHDVPVALVNSVINTKGGWGWTQATPIDDAAVGRVPTT